MHTKGPNPYDESDRSHEDHDNSYDDLRNWPYAWRLLEESLDPTLIEEHGLRHLYRALNIGNLVAFVGSGTSQSYGRLSWEALIRTQCAQVLERFTKWEEWKKREPASPHTHIDQRIRALKETLDALESTSKPDDYPIKFQVAETLHQALLQAEGMRENIEGSGDPSFRDTTKRLTYDDREYTRSLFGDEADRDPDKNEGRDGLGRNLPEFKDRSKYFEFLAPFEKTYVTRLQRCDLALGELPDTQHIGDISRLIKELLERKSNLAAMAPPYRFLVAAAVTILPKHKRPQLRPFPSDFDYTARRAIIEAHHDPLLNVMMGLRIHRFLTTNYDLEIERLLLDRGYRLSEDPQRDDSFRRDRIDPIGGQARDIAYSPKTAAELISFATQSTGADAKVVHLHGRSTDESNIVVTERDYMNLYLRTDESRDLIDESVTLAFSANPILFIGLGMGEADLLRPLRQFMSNQENRRNRTAIALMPLRGGRMNGIRERVSLFARYGVHVVHYGRATFESGSTANNLSGVGDDKEKHLIKSEGWLGAMVGLIKAGIRLAEDLDRWDLVKVRDEDVLRKLQVDHTNLGWKLKEARSLCGDDTKLKSPEMLDGSPVDLQSEISLMEAVIQCLIKNSTFPHGVQPEPFKRLLIVTRLILEGLETVIMTTAFCAKLQGIERSWRDWWSNWQTAPLERGVQFAMKSQAPLIAIRHRLKIEDSEGRSDSGKRSPAHVHQVDSRLQSSTFRLFKQALKDNPTSSHLAQRRRIYVIAAARGMGKGHFFSEFQDPRNWKSFETASWVESPGGPSCPQYRGFIFVNLSFSSEVSSAWDGVIENLEKVWAGPDGADHEDARVESNKRAKDLPRVTRLRRILRELSKDPSSRVVIAINAIDLLFDVRGKSKNTEIERLFEVFTGLDTKKSPFDLVVIGNERRLPSVFRSPTGTHGRKLEFRLLVRNEASPRSRDAIHQRRVQSGVNAVADPSITLNFVQFPRPFKAHEFLVDRFPRLAVLLVLDWYRHTRKKEAQRWPIRAKLMRGGRTLGVSTRVAQSTFERVANIQDAKEKLDAGIGVILPLFSNRSSRKFFESIREDYDQSDGSGRRVTKWKNALQALNQNRFCLTILLRAADFMATEALAATRPDRPLEIRQIVGEIDDFLTDTMHHALASSQGRREEVVLTDVLNRYEQYHQAKSPRRDALFHLALIRHLAVIGQPTSADVLALAPEIARLLAEWNGSGTMPFECRRQKVAEGLEALTDYCLVFRIEPHKADPRSTETASTDSMSLDRYALHRLMQRHVLRKMDGPLVEFAEANDFAVSLYAAQAKELPRPTIEAYRFLRDLVSALSHYPEPSSWAQESKDLITLTTSAAESKNRGSKVRALRAALGVIRSIFSTAVVSRFREYDEYTPANRSRPGYFEEHRLQVRWLLSRALSLSHPLDKAKDSAGPLHAFYLDEIIWLYNECGVISLVQGNMSDSVALLRQALNLNRSVEGRQGYGSQGARIGLNLAIAQIERANLRSTSQRLLDIQAIAGEAPAIRAIATGYLGLVDHLGGDLKSAERLYRKATDTLAKEEQSRAASIFFRHRGDLMTMKRDWERAERFTRQSIAFAQSGGHEDMRAFARLSLIRTRTRRTPGLTTKISSQLREIEDYATAMEMPRLLSEVLHLRARILAQQGEHRLAGQLISRSISIATRNDLRLRKMSALCLYGRILIARGQIEQGRHLALTAMDMARKAGCQIEIERAERALRDLPPTNPS